MLLAFINQASIDWKSIDSKFKPLMGYAQLFIEEIFEIFLRPYPILAAK